VSQDQRSPAADHLRTLSEGEVEVVGRLPWSSNGTFLVTCTTTDGELAAVYKPLSGERALWDFPDGLYRREAAAWVLSEALGWAVVPETIVRHDAPFGVGSLQRFVPADFRQHYFTLLEDQRHHDRLRTVCAFDVVANNADRKSGHCLLGEDGTIWAIDNGLCFHPEPKLRTVIWDFAGEEIPDDQRADLQRVADHPPAALGDLLAAEELAALRRRAGRLAQRGTLPEPDGSRHQYPWPLV
jgi:uncharacterized repeat protein (TIGR03843 family)